MLGHWHFVVIDAFDCKVTRDMTKIQKRPYTKRARSKRTVIAITVTGCFVSALWVMFQLLQQPFAEAPSFSSQKPSEAKSPSLTAHLQVIERNVTGTLDFVDNDSLFCARTCQVHLPLVQDSKNGELLRRQNGLQSPSHYYLITRKGDKDQIGFSPLPNQDRVLLYTQARSEANQNTALLLTLADGHGEYGHDASHLAVNELPRKIMKRLKTIGGDSTSDSSTAMKEAIAQAFIETDQMDSMRSIREGGTTVIVVLKQGNTVYLASAGDSTAMLVKTTRGHSAAATLEHEIVTQSRKHKPADPDERKRIEAKGGMVLDEPPGQQGMSSRVIVGPVSLAMSRCLGDSDGKELGLLTAEPTIREYTMDKTADYFVMAATDGVVDFVSNMQDLVNTIGTTLHERDTKLPHVAQGLMDQAAGQWNLMTNGRYRDDMSLAIAKL